MESRLKKHYRRMQGFMALFIAALLSLCFFFPQVLKSNPGLVLLVFIGAALIFAVWSRQGMSRDGILPAEFRAYSQVQPMIIAVQIVLFLLFVMQAIRLITGK